jgi:hypothetical protein
MQEDPTTDYTDNQTQQLDIDRDDWEFAFQPFEGNPREALLLGFNLAVLRAYLDTRTIKYRKAIEALDLALEVLFPLTHFHTASYSLFLKYMDGQLTFDEEQMLNALGIKF